MADIRFKFHLSPKYISLQVQGSEHSCQQTSISRKEAFITSTSNWFFFVLVAMLHGDLVGDWTSNGSRTIETQDILFLAQLHRENDNHHHHLRRSISDCKILYRLNRFQDVRLGN